MKQYTISNIQATGHDLVDSLRQLPVQERCWQQSLHM